MAEKKEQSPLLYIYQPFARTPSIKMQDVYTNRREKGLKEVDQQKEVPIQEAVPIEVTVSGKQEVINQEVNKQENENQKFSFKKVKSFKDMNIKEKLEYLIDFPTVLPPQPCVFYVKDKSYQGYLQDYQDQEITIQFHDQSTKTIPLSSLKNVIMIGIKK